MVKMQIGVRNFRCRRNDIIERESVAVGQRQNISEWLAQSHFSLEVARAAAAVVLDDPKQVRTLMKALFSDNAILRCRAADVARRITERDRELLARYAQELTGILAELPQGENRTRWHLALVAARSARTGAEVRRCAAILWSMARDPSNVVRCSVIEGFAELALLDQSLQAQAEQLIEAALLNGTTAMICRARHAMKKLARVGLKGM